MRGQFRLEWIDALAIDRGEVDAQHRYLFDLYNKILEGPEEQVDQASVVKSLSDYATVHFRDEESWMSSISYPEAKLAEHRESHEYFVTQLEVLKEGPLYLILDFYREWLLRHIISEDRQIRVFLDHRSVP